MLCTSGEKTQIWTVESKLTLLHTFDIGSKEIRVVDWNQNSKPWKSISLRQLHICVLEQWRHVSKKHKQSDADLVGQ